MRGDCKGRELKGRIMRRGVRRGSGKGYKQDRGRERTEGKG